MRQLLLATRNGHKTREFAEILGQGFDVSDLTGAKNIPEVEETGTTFEENAVLKAVAASRFVSGLVVSDDSGLEVVALHGAPGVRSARYASEHANDQQNVAKLLSDLRVAGETDSNRSARFCCALALAEAGKIVRVFFGTVSGSVMSGPRGSGGFGYDPVFIPDGYDATFGELGDAVKNQISHRAQAIAQLRDYLAGRNR